MIETIGCMIGGLVMLAAIIVITRFDALLSIATDEMRRGDR